MKMQTSKGTRDVGPVEKRIKNQLVRNLSRAFELYGFAPLETPIIERYETLAAKGGAGAGSDAINEIFRLSDQGKRKLGLRFELTTSLARFVAMNPNLKLPFKRYEIGRVFRDGPIKLGRYREFWQCDVDVVGTKSMLADAELLSLVQYVFTQLKLNVVIKVNNRKLLNGILTQCGIKNKKDAIIVIDKLAKMGEKEVRAELAAQGNSKDQVAMLFALIGPSITLRDLKQKVTDPEGQEGVKEIVELFGYLRKLKVSKAKFDVTLARGLGYYTGTVFEAFAVNGPVESSLAAGGRWDDMIGNFMGGGRRVPAVGASFGLAPIMDTLRLSKKIAASPPCTVFIIPIGTTKECLVMVQKLRAAGVSAAISMRGKGVSKSLQAANAWGIPYVLIVGEDELKKGKVLMRDMKSGRESMVDFAMVMKRLKLQKNN